MVEAYGMPNPLNSKGLRVFLLARRTILGQGKNTLEWRGKVSIQMHLRGKSARRPKTQHALGPSVEVAELHQPVR